MARGRMINTTICTDRRIHDLSDDTSRLAFTWLITFADCEGRVHGDPLLVRSMLFPRRSDITEAQIAGYIAQWTRAGLVVLYEADGDIWLAFPAFEKNQAGLRKDREAPSAIPAPPALTNSGVTPDQLRTNSRLTELNRTELELELEVEEKRVRAQAPARRERRQPSPKSPSVEAYHQVTGKNPKRETEPLICEAVGELPEDLALFKRTISVWAAAKYDPRNINGILDWYREYKAGNDPAAYRGNGAGHGRDSPLIEPKGWAGLRNLEVGDDRLGVQAATRNAHRGMAESRDA